MCDSLTLLVDTRFGAVLRLCSEPDGPVTCIAKNLLFIDLQRERDGRLRRTGLVAALEAMCSKASYLVVEPHYFDLDYRSEFSVTHESSFRVRLPGVLRFHFFSQGSPVIDDDIPLRDFVKAYVDNYLGYMIIRPQPFGIVGRSMICTDVQQREHPELGSLAQHVRTPVREYVQLFGVSLSANGVPFMEQDGHLLRCAHVSAWICHYSAVLRGLVTRRSTAEFHGTDDSYAPYGRVYPSQGLTVNGLTASLRRVGLPPEVLDQQILLEKREPQWYDTIEDGNWPTKPAHLKDGEYPRFWIRKNLTESICRYLNSGVACVIAREKQAHTQVAIGYLREEDFSRQDQREQNKKEAHQDIRSDVTHLLVTDDQIGPFEVVDVNVLVEEIVSGLTSIVVPLPKSLLLSGREAEQRAALLIETFGRRALNDLDDIADEELEKTVQEFCDATTRPVAGEPGETVRGDLTIRTYATTGADFKESWARRLSKVEGCTEPGIINEENLDVIRLVSHMPLPKYVWVSECIDRKKRKDGSLYIVRGTVVLDAFDIVVLEGKQSRVLPLFIHVPSRGYAVGIATTYGLGSQSVRDVSTSSQPYLSGRRPQDDDYHAAYRIAERSKGATAKF